MTWYVSVLSASQKCELYWPQCDNEPGTFGRFRLGIIARTKKHGFTITDISVQVRMPPLLPIYFFMHLFIYLYFLLPYC